MSHLVSGSRATCTSGHCTEEHRSPEGLSLLLRNSSREKNTLSGVERTAFQSQLSCQHCLQNSEQGTCRGHIPRVPEVRELPILTAASCVEHLGSVTAMLTAQSPGGSRPSATETQSGWVMPQPRMRRMFLEGSQESRTLGRGWPAGLRRQTRRSWGLSEGAHGPRLPGGMVSRDVTGTAARLATFGHQCSECESSHSALGQGPHPAFASVSPVPPPTSWESPGRCLVPECQGQGGQHGLPHPPVSPCHLHRCQCFCPDGVRPSVVKFATVQLHTALSSRALLFGCILDALIRHHFQSQFLSDSRALRATSGLFNSTVLDDNRAVNDSVRILEVVSTHLIKELTATNSGYSHISKFQNSNFIVLYKILAIFRSAHRFFFSDNMKKLK